ncbi:unnamed protein product [Diamesa serratosioi]
MKVLISILLCFVLFSQLASVYGGGDSSPCSLGKDMGPCKAFFTKCQLASVYGGGDSFLTDSTDPCVLRQDSGPCKAFFVKWYYTGSDCRQFVYGGCLGNANRFDTKEECDARCAK